ncbi:MAG: DNA primase DnaG [Candidatus Woesearchaeota archaeon]
MGKISPVSAKYIIHAHIAIEGVVDRPDVIGAVFGQTEGLIGSELELRELQRSGRIGRIEVILDTKNGKTQGSITIPSSLDKAETSIIGASLEIIERIGPCNASVQVKKIEDVRISKRGAVINRAKELLRDMMEKTMPDSQEIADEVTSAVRVMEITSYGKERIPAGPAIDESDEIIIVEGRADVLNLLKYGFKNAIAMNGTSVPQTVKDLAAKKTATVFLDGDRGGDLILKELLATTELDFVSRAPDGKEVEELTKKEIHKALRGKIAVEQAKLESETPRPSNTQKRSRKERPERKREEREEAPAVEELSAENRERLRILVEDLIGTKAVFFVNDKLDVLGKVPLSELESTLADLPGTYAIVVDNTIDKDLCKTAKKANVRIVAGADKKTTNKDEEGLLVFSAAELTEA